MKPIINPLWFYLANIVENVGGLLFTIAMFSGGIFVVLLLCGALECFNLEAQMKNLKRLLITCIITSILTSLCPTKDTCYQMMTATMITPNNITAVGDAATDVVDYIIESVDTLLDAEDEESD